jgi:hypothetical protein
MERRLRIFEMDEEADPVALAQSRLLPDPFPQEYAATWARRAINLTAVKHSHDDLWSYVMLPYGPLVSGFLPLLPLFVCEPPAWPELSLIFRSW